MITALVIGSKALSMYIPEVQPKHDIDLIMTYEDYKKYLAYLPTTGEGVLSFFPTNGGKKAIIKTTERIHEIEFAWDGSTAKELMDLVMSETVVSTYGYIGAITYYVPKLDVLYALKMSHRYLKNSPHFNKTMNHIRLMRQAGAKLDFLADFDDKWYNWYQRREAETYDYSHPNLDTNKNDFFKDETFYKYDHDDIHESIKLGDIPAYKRILEDGAQVKCSAKKFRALTHEQRLHCALEESYTLALERSLIPHDFKTNPDAAFKYAVMKVCTSITSGWFREWCWENYEEIVASYSPEYVVLFKRALDNGKIRPFTHDREYRVE